MSRKTAASGSSEGEWAAPAHGKNPSFLSILKAIHQTSKLYIAFLVSFAGIPAVVITGAINWGIPLWIAGIGSAVPAGLISLWLVPTWIQQRNKRIAIEWGVHGQIKDPEYFRLIPYDSSADFRRADNAHEQVYRWLADNPAPLIYLSGVSGSGKSSIISAYALPRLAREGVPVCIVSARVVGDPTAALTEALMKPGAIWERPPSGRNEGLRDILERAARKVAPRKLLLVLDQFEEFLILADDDQRNAFETLLHSLIERPVRDLQMLMILRSDYRALLDALALPAAEKDRKEVPAFLERDAMAFLRDSGLKVSSEVECEILEEARDVEQTTGLIRPITVNLIGLVLRRFETLPRNYRKGTLLRSYLRELIQRREIRDFAPLILRSMMTGNGTKIPVSYLDVARVTGLDPRLVRGCLVQLANEGVARELDHERGKWEFAHDFIAGLYHQILAGWRVSVWRRARPWVICGGIVLWIFGVLTLPILVSDRHENQERQWLLDHGFNNEHCDALIDDAGCSAWMATDDVDDTILAAAIPHLTRLKKGYSLDLSAAAGLSSIQGLENMTNLRRLILKGANVERIDALRTLTGMRILDLSETKVSDISALKLMASLQDLSLKQTGISDIGALKDLTGLQMLDLWGTGVENIDALRNLTRLNFLNLHGTHVEDITALKDLVDIRTLDLNSTHIKNIDALGNLKNMETIDISDTRIDSIVALHNMNHLKNLYLKDTRVKDINSLNDMLELHILILSDTRVENLDALKGLTNLETLFLTDTVVNNIDALKGLTRLQRLDLSHTLVDNIDALTSLTSLNNLEISDTPIKRSDLLKLKGVLPNAYIGSNESLY